jgi:hypothetical protein
MNEYLILFGDINDTILIFRNFEFIHILQLFNLSKVEKSLVIKRVKLLSLSAMNSKQTKEAFVPNL